MVEVNEEEANRHIENVRHKHPPPMSWPDAACIIAALAALVVSLMVLAGVFS